MLNLISPQRMLWATSFSVLSSVIVQSFLSALFQGGWKIPCDRMYYTLLCDSIELDADRRTNCYGSSGGNQHMSHNRTVFDKPGKYHACSNPAGIPVFNVMPTYADNNDRTSNHEWNYADSSKKKKSSKSLKDHCKLLEVSFLELCKENWTSLAAKKPPKKTRKGRKIHSQTKINSTPAAEGMSAFLLAVQKLGRNGCGHISPLISSNCLPVLVSSQQIWWHIHP